MSIDIHTETRQAVTVLAIERRVRHTEVAPALADVLPRVFAYAMEMGFSIAGPPLCRYSGWTSGGVTICAGVPVSQGVDASGSVTAMTIPAGTYVVSVHTGDYESIDQTHAAIEEWAATRKRSIEATSYEVYLTDPDEVPDPANWQTEVLRRVIDS